MKITDYLSKALHETDNLYPDGEYNPNQHPKVNFFPEMMTSENGISIILAPETTISLRQISTLLYQSLPDLHPLLSGDRYSKIVLQSFVDCYSSDLLKDEDIESSLKSLKDSIKSKIDRIHTGYTVYLPAWTLGAEYRRQFALGPIVFLSKFQWIEQIQSSERMVEYYAGLGYDISNWKEELKIAFEQPKSKVKLSGIANELYEAIGNCPSILKITLPDREQERAKEEARILGKIALDCISLLTGGEESFRRYVLREERVPPISTSTLLERNGFIFLPGMKLDPRIGGLPSDMVDRLIQSKSRLISAYGQAIQAVIDPSSHPAPNLAKRWTTALNWYGEGCREIDDAIALAKIASCLDVLSAGGTFGGITDLLAHLLEIPEDKVVINTPPTTLKSLVKKIYNNGRSWILHGTTYDKLVSYKEERRHAVSLGHFALTEIAMRLTQYRGPDEQDAFLRIPPLQSQENTSQSPN